MLKPKPFNLHLLSSSGAALLTIDDQHIKYVQRLPYVSSVTRHLPQRDCYFVIFDARYDAHEAFEELQRELESETAPVELGNLLDGE